MGPPPLSHRLGRAGPLAVAITFLGKKVDRDYFTRQDLITLQHVSNVLKLKNAKQRMETRQFIRVWSRSQADGNYFQFLLNLNRDGLGVHSITEIEHYARQFVVSCIAMRRTLCGPMAA